MWEERENENYLRYLKGGKESVEREDVRSYEKMVLLSHRNRHKHLNPNKDFEWFVWPVEAAVKAGLRGNQALIDEAARLEREKPGTGGRAFGKKKGKGKGKGKGKSKGKGKGKDRGESGKERQDRKGENMGKGKGNIKGRPLGVLGSGGKGADWKPPDETDYTRAAPLYQQQYRPRAPGRFLPWNEEMVKRDRALGLERAPQKSKGWKVVEGELVEGGLGEEKSDSLLDNIIECMSGDEEDFAARMDKEE